MRTCRSLVAGAFDVIAEATVLPSFSRSGIAVRRRLEGWERPPSMAGETVVVTGATSGIGLAAATALAGLGATVHLVGRDAERGRRALAAVEVAAVEAPAGEARTAEATARLDLVDMGDVDEVTAFGTRLMERYDSLAALVHNAGTLSRVYRLSAGGVESTVATQILGPYALTATLAPLLCKAPGRVVTVSSGGMYTQRFDLGTLEMNTDDYDGPTAYARVKRAQVVLADGWARHFGGAGVSSYSMHPGWVDTPGLEAGLPRFRSILRPLLRTPAEGADTLVWLAAGGPSASPAGRGTAGTGGRVEGGSLAGFFHDRRRRPDGRFPLTTPMRPGDAEALMSWCAGRTGIETPVMMAPEK